MASALLCASSRTKEGRTRKKAGKNGAESRVHSRADHLRKERDFVVRYSAIDKVDNGDLDQDEGFQTCESQTSHAKDGLGRTDELGILRLTDRQKVTFHLKKRTRQEQKKEERETQIEKAGEIQTENERESQAVQSRAIFKNESAEKQKSRHKKQDREKYAALLRNRVMDVVKDIHRDLEKMDASSARPWTHDGGKRRLKLESFGTCLTQQETHELKQLLAEILRKKLKDGGWPKDESATPRDRSRATVRSNNDAYVTSTKRHKQSHRRPPTKYTKPIASTKVADYETVNDQCVETLKEKTKKITPKVVSASHEYVVNSGDQSHVKKEETRRVFCPHESPRPRLRLHALGHSSRDSTADWIMKQDFEQFNDEEECDVTNEIKTDAEIVGSAERV